MTLTAGFPVQPAFTQAEVDHARALRVATEAVEVVPLGRLALRELFARAGIRGPVKPDDQRPGLVRTADGKPLSVCDEFGGLLDDHARAQARLVAYAINRAIAETP